MKRISLFVLVAVCCTDPALARTSLERLLAKQSVFQLDSVRTRDELEGCIAPRLSDLGLPSIIHGAGRSDLVYAKGAIVVSLIERSPGTVIEARYILPTRIRGKIESCLTGPVIPAP